MSLVFGKTLIEINKGEEKQVNHENTQKKLNILWAAHLQTQQQQQKQQQQLWLPLMKQREKKPMAQADLTQKNLITYKHDGASLGVRRTTKHACKQLSLA